MRKSRLAVGATGSCVFAKSRRLTYVCKISHSWNRDGLCSCLGPCKFSSHGFWDRIVHLVENISRISWKCLSVCILNVQGNSYQGRAFQWGGATAGHHPPTPETLNTPRPMQCQHAQTEPAKESTKFV